MKPDLRIASTLSMRMLYRWRLHIVATDPVSGLRLVATDPGPGLGVYGATDPVFTLHDPLAYPRK